MDFSETLKRLRSKQKLTQEDLANKVGVSRATIAGYETKGKKPPYSTLIKIAKALNCSIDYLLGNDNSEDKHELNSLFTKITQRNDLQQLLKQVEDLNPASINRIVSMLKIIEEEVEERNKGEK